MNLDYKIYKELAKSYLNDVKDLKKTYYIF